MRTEVTCEDCGANFRDVIAHELAEKIRNYKHVKKDACRTTQHCAYWGWCYRCNPEWAGMDRAARLVEMEVTK